MSNCPKGTHTVPCTCAQTAETIAKRDAFNKLPSPEMRKHLKQVAELKNPKAGSQADKDRVNALLGIPPAETKEAKEGPPDLRDLI